jgi:hypothetical protein
VAITPKEKALFITVCIILVGVLMAAMPTFDARAARVACAAAAGAFGGLALVIARR